MINTPSRMRFKVATSFAIALLGIIALVRLLSIAPLSGATLAAYAVLFVLIAAAAWRGIIYMRALRQAPPTRS
ncbi:MAG: hypothetical protein JO219_07610 [Candidatus Eremiobacteraeota bacterium]|nr:hypothetical protein [Candidatus Eremiobacteraeota bacterium]